MSGYVQFRPARPCDLPLSRQLQYRSVQVLCNCIGLYCRLLYTYSLFTPVEHLYFFSYTLLSSTIVPTKLSLRRPFLSTRLPRRRQPQKRMSQPKGHAYVPVTLPNGQVFLRSPANPEEWIMIELQGELNSTAKSAQKKAPLAVCYVVTHKPHSYGCPRLSINTP